MTKELVGKQMAMHGHQRLVISSTVRQVEELAVTVTKPGMEADQ